MLSDTQITAFIDLFTGRTDAFGSGAGRVHRAPLTRAHYEWHLSGGLDGGLGVFPLTDNGMVRFAAIDLDRPDFDGIKAVRELLPEPLWIEKSRSGNYHLWAFFDQPIEAWIVRGLMLAAIDAAGLGIVEVFPKQASLVPGMVGNYINLPLHGDERPFVTGEGNAIPRGVAIDAAFASRADADAWRRRASWLGITDPSLAEPAGDGTTTVLHPCAAKIIAERDTNPIRSGHRNVVMFNLAKQLIAYRDFGDDEALSYLHLVNASAEPPLPHTVIETIFKNAKRGGYRSTGCDDPLMAPYVDPDCPILRKAGLRV